MELVQEAEMGRRIKEKCKKQTWKSPSSEINTFVSWNANERGQRDQGSWILKLCFGLFLQREHGILDVLELGPLLGYRWL